MAAEEMTIRAAFAEYDRDNSGRIDAKELAGLAQDLGIPFIDDDELAAAVRVLDADSSGQIDCAEFMSWWKNKAQSALSSDLELKLAELAKAGREKHHSDVHMASWQGKTAIVQQFLDLDSNLIGEMDTSEYGVRGCAFTVLDAVNSAQRSAWQASCDCFPQDNNLPLHYAAYNGHLAVCELLVRAVAP